MKLITLNNSLRNTAGAERGLCGVAMTPRSPHAKRVVTIEQKTYFFEGLAL
jgi:hypothetical protein